jgi:hypothetical protein
LWRTCVKCLFGIFFLISLSALTSIKYCGKYSRIIIKTTVFYLSILSWFMLCYRSRKDFLFLDHKLPLITTNTYVSEWKVYFLDK